MASIFIWVISIRCFIFSLCLHTSLSFFVLIPFSCFTYFKISITIIHKKINHFSPTGSSMIGCYLLYLWRTNSKGQSSPSYDACELLEASHWHCWKQNNELGVPLSDQTRQFFCSCDALYHHPSSCQKTTCKHWEIFLLPLKEPEPCCLPLLLLSNFSVKAESKHCKRQNGWAWH